MIRSHQPNQSIAASTFELRRAAGNFQELASAPGALAGLPLALADVEKAIEQLAVGAVKAAQAVEDRAACSGQDALSPEARALRWHLFHLAARLRGVEDACPETRRWARSLLARQDIADHGEQATKCPSLVTHGDAVAR